MLSILVGNLPTIALGAALITGVFLFWRQGKRLGFDEDSLLDLSLITLLSAIVGGKLYYAFFHYQMVSKNALLLLRFWEGPYAFNGCLLVGGLAGYIFSLRKGWSILKIADTAVISFASSIFIYSLFSLWPWEGNFLLLGQALLNLSLLLALALVRERFIYSGFLAFSYLAAFSFLEFGFGFFHSPDVSRIEVIGDRLFYLALFIFGVLGLARRKKEVPGGVRMNLPKNLLDQIKSKLLREESALAQQQSGLEESEPYLEPGRAEINAEFIEDAQEDVAQTRYSLVRDSVAKMRSQIQKALSKLHLGTYGRCETCGKQIDPARLKAFPAATLCLDCATKADEAVSEQEEGLADEDASQL